MYLPRFLVELKRRKVYRAAIVYSGISWVLLEVADVAFPRLGLPDWTVNFVLALILVGFPIAIVFAWIFEFSPQGVVRTEPVSPDAGRHFQIITYVEFGIIAALVSTVGYLYIDRLALQKRLVEPSVENLAKPQFVNSINSRPERYSSIAVLPFADMSESGDHIWFAEGISEELLNGLAQVESLNVMARTSSFAFKDSEQTVADIADILGVQTVLEGSVRRSGDRVRISAQLVDARNGFNIWSGSYERQLADIFDLQDELARAIVGALRVELGVDPTAPLIIEQTTSVEAYNWFVRGRAIWNWDNHETTKQSISYFEKAVLADPDYAQAWGYLAFARMTSMLWKTFDEIGPAAISAYESALALDSEQSEALATKALMTQLLERDWETAGKLYRQAMATRDNSNAMVLYSVLYLMHVEQFSEAIRLNADAETRDPLHAGYKSNLAHLLLLSGDTEAAVFKAEESLELNPMHVLTITYLIQIYADTGNLDALNLLFDGLPPSLLEQSELRALSGRYYLARGDEKRARQIYMALQTQADSMTPIGQIFAADLALSLGETDESLDMLEQVLEGGSWIQFHIRTMFRNNENMHKHPRYQSLLRRMGLDDESVTALNQKISTE